MKKNIFFLIAILTLTIVSCNTNCNDIDAPASPSLFVDIIDENTQENVFKDSIYLDTQVLVKDYEENDISFSIIDNSKILHIVLENDILIDDTIYIKMNNPETMQKDSIKLFYSTEKIEMECYTQYKTNSVTFPDNENELTNGIYKVKL
jgi:hypothetical protein